MVSSIGPIEGLVSEGARIEVGDVLLKLHGPASLLVALERTALNLAMRLSGIATATAALVAQLEGTGVALADTRKTTPGSSEAGKICRPLRWGDQSPHGAR
jgi:nicotinate-nucleotide pyrophosphorylase (carboxylating)